jgi:hypothetical protein
MCKAHHRRDSSFGISTLLAPTYSSLPTSRSLRAVRNNNIAVYEHCPGKVRKRPPPLLFERVRQLLRRLAPSRPPCTHSTATPPDGMRCRISPIIRIWKYRRLRSRACRLVACLQVLPRSLAAPPARYRSAGKNSHHGRQRSRIDYNSGRARSHSAGRIALQSRQPERTGDKLTPGYHSLSHGRSVQAPVGRGVGYFLHRANDEYRQREPKITAVLRPSTAVLRTSAQDDTARLRTSLGMTPLGFALRSD